MAEKLQPQDTLRVAYPKINDAIDDANSAKTQSDDAVNTANEAKFTSEEAKTQAESTQDQLDTIVIESGTSDAETLQARTNNRGTTFNTLNDRINDLDIEFKDRGINVQWYNASGSMSQTTGSITSGTNVLTVSDVIDFKIGQGITVEGAGISGDLITEVTDINGADITLLDTASTTVTNANVYHDDTTAIQNAIEDAKVLKTRVFLPKGTYIISNTLECLNGGHEAGAIEGVNERGVIIKTRLQGTTPAFSFTGDSSGFSNTGLKNIYIEADSDYIHQGTAIYLAGVVFAKFENIHIHDMNYGIWLHNKDSSSPYTEINRFTNVEIHNTMEQIRMEQGLGDPSFHGNDFDNVHLNIFANQIGFNHVSGYYYNGRMNILAWCHDTTGVYIHANGNAENLVGDFTYESFEDGQFTGSGKFWVHGFLRGIEGLADNTTERTDGRDVVVFQNYWKKRSYGSSGFTAGIMNRKNWYTAGSAGMIEGFGKPGHESVLINTYTGTDDGLYLGQTSYGQNESNGKLGVLIGSLGDKLKTFFAGGWSIVTSDNKTAAFFKDGRFGGNPGKNEVETIPGDGAWKNIILDVDYPYEHVFSLISLKIAGNGFEMRKTYIGNYELGGDGSLVEMSTHKDSPLSGVTVHLVKMDSNGKINIEITNDIEVVADCKAMGIGLF